MLRIQTHFVRPDEFPLLINECRNIAQSNGMAWNEQHAQMLHAWQERQFEIYPFTTLDDLVEQVLEFAISGKPVPGQYQIRAEDLVNARRLRKIHRIGKIFELSRKQISVIAPGVNLLPADQLLPLDHHWVDQQQRWIRTQDGRYVQLKPKGENNETDVSAFGDPNNPSMVYWRYESIFTEDTRQPGRQLGHRYQATSPDNRAPIAIKPEKIFSYDHSEDRTYGGKTGNGRGNNVGAYKVTGMVDGHGIQACDDQVNLDAVQRRLHATADRHPHTMYWENEKFGAAVRQDYFEEYAKIKVTWLLQVNEFSSYYNPTMLPTNKKRNKNAPANVISPDRTHLRMQRKDTTAEYWSFNNKREANYNNLVYRVQNGDYAIVPWSNGKRPAGFNRSLGEVKLEGKHSKKSKDHLRTVMHAKANEVKDIKRTFPAAQVIDVSKPEFDSSQFLNSKSRVPGYTSPPITPHYLTATETQITLPGVHFEGEVLTPGENRSSFIASTNARNVGGHVQFTKVSLEHNPKWKLRRERKQQQAAAIIGDAAVPAPTSIAVAPHQEESVAVPPPPSEFASVSHHDLIPLAEGFVDKIVPPGHAVVEEKKSAYVTKDRQGNHHMHTIAALNVATPSPSVSRESLSASSTLSLTPSFSSPSSLLSTPSNVSVSPALSESPGESILGELAVLAADMPPSPAEPARVEVVSPPTASPSPAGEQLRNQLRGNIAPRSQLFSPPNKKDVADDLVVNPKVSLGLPITNPS